MQLIMSLQQYGMLLLKLLHHLTIDLVIIFYDILLKFRVIPGLMINQGKIVFFSGDI